MLEIREIDSPVARATARLSSAWVIASSLSCKRPEKATAPNWGGRVKKHTTAPQAGRKTDQGQRRASIEGQWLSIQSTSAASASLRRPNGPRTGPLTSDRSAVH